MSCYFIQCAKAEIKSFPMVYDRKFHVQEIFANFKHFSCMRIFRTPAFKKNLQIVCPAKSLNILSRIFRVVMCQSATHKTYLKKTSGRNILLTYIGRKVIAFGREEYGKSESTESFHDFIVSELNFNRGSTHF